LAPVLPALLVLLALLAQVVAPRPARAEALNRIVLRVNDQIATLYDYERRRTDTVREIVQRVQDVNERRNAIAQAPENIFWDMFQEMLLSSRADQLAIEVADAEVDQELAGMRQRFGIKNDEEFQTAVRQSGMTMEQLRNQTRRNLRIRGDVQGGHEQGQGQGRGAPALLPSAPGPVHGAGAGSAARGGGARGQRAAGGGARPHRL
jgi:hypothetical protein